MNNIIKQLSFLYEQELHSDVVRVAELAISFCEQKQDIIMQITKFQLYVYYAESLFHLQQYPPAENAFSTALQLRKCIIKSKTNTDLQEGEKAFFNDVDIKFKLHLCCLKLRQFQKAIEVLQSIPARSRSAKINMALGNLYRDAGLERSAVAVYKEVIRECPIALDAAENLLKLGVKGVDVNSMMLGATLEAGWISTWLRGVAEMYSREHSSAIETFKSLDMPGILKGNIPVLVNIAQCCNFICDEKKAINVLQRAQRLDPNFINGRGFYASLLANSSDKDHHRELEKLIPDYDASLWSSDHWVAMGFHAYTLNQYERAIYFGQQALHLNHKNIEALLLKAATCMQMKKYTEASNHYRAALQACPHRFESNYGLVQSYIAMNRLREATTVANNACKQMNHVSAALTLYASVLLKDPINNSRARTILERAIKADQTYIPPVRLLAEYFDSEHLYDEAVSVLKHNLEVNPSSRIHQMLGDVYVRLQKEDDAFEHYSIALRMDAQNQRALEGINNIGRATPHTMDSTFKYLSPGGETSTYSNQAPANSSDQEGDPDSDTEPWLNNSMDIMSFD